MCLYPKIIQNPKYKPNKKNKGNPPICDDQRKKTIPVGCGQCIECRRKKVREWWIRIEWENKTNEIRGKGVTLSFSEESLNKLPTDANEAAARAIRLFSKRWEKRYKKAPRYWLIPELGHENTERLHIHGILWVREHDKIEEIWQYGNVKVEPMNEDTPTYITKYVLKPDEKHKGWIGKVFASKGIGKGFKDSATAEEYIRQAENAKQYLKTRKGAKIDIPMYYRNKLFDEETREKIWTKLLDKQTRYVMGKKIDVSTREGIELYYKTLEYEQKQNERLGYPNGNWSKKKYQETRKKAKIEAINEFEIE